MGLKNDINNTFFFCVYLKNKILFIFNLLYIINLNLYGIKR